jgi:hypothetical protein
VTFLLERMTRQGLAARSTADPAVVATSAVGIQAQDLGASRLGIRARTSSVDSADVERAFETDRSVVRTWLMRATVHLVAAADVVWMTALFGPMIERRFLNVRWRELGLTEKAIDRALPIADEVLAGRELTRHELAAELADRGIRLAADAQAATHLLVALSARGLSCRGPERGRDATFARVADWAGRGPMPDDPLAELARRYFRAFGPATAADFTTWSGLPSGKALAAVRDELTEVEFDGRRGWSLGRVEPVGGVRLLPMFDNYLLGYRDRAAILPVERQASVYVGGIIKATVLLDGRIVGRWRLGRTRAGATVEIEPFEAFPRRVRTALEGEVADVARFLTCPTNIRYIG